jgi:peptidoglycan/LPS O-acetylase OafA/YrhL
MVKSSQIQGLRALAVLLVLVFHADWLPGGYIGVDVFYVISGYLITNLIINDSNFSLKNFYIRRAKRLLPVSYLVLIVTATIFWFFAPTLSLVQFSRDLFSSTWYFANINFAFWQNDYQNLGASPSPLIHYWSLAVEEQFYLFWPLLLMLFTKRRKRLVVVLSLASLFISILLISVAPIWSFYLLPTRAFELGIGAFLAIYKMRVNLPNLGLTLIAVSAIIFNASSNFPGIPALLPTVGAALVVTASSNNWLLNNPLSQRIGDWSYSIYLWHWPILILPTIALERELTNLERVIALLLTVLVSAGTFHYFENPFRKKKIDSPKNLFRFGASLFVMALTLSVLSLLMYKTGQNHAEKFDLKTVRMQPIIYEEGCQLDKRATRPNLKCVYGKVNAEKTIVLLGDSHAAQWFPAINRWALDRGYRFLVMTKSSCPASNIPLRDDGAFKASVCKEFRNNATVEINRVAPDLVIMGSAENHREISSKSYLNLPAVNSKILILKDTPWPSRDIPTCVADGSKNCDIPRPNSVEYPGQEIFDPIPFLCQGASCSASIDGVIAYRDHSHISVQMALKLYPALAQKLDSVVAR